MTDHYQFNQARSKKTISARFRQTNIVLFAAASVIIVLVMRMALQNITDTVSKDYASLYSTNTSAALSTYLNREISLIQKAANSEAVANWFADEGNQEKKAAAHAEIIEIIGALYSDNIYLGIQDSLNEYTVEASFSIQDVKPYATLRPDYYDDAWYFECVASGDDYVLNVDVDKILHRKRVWINRKVTRDGVVLGAICSGLEFAESAEAIFSEYDTTKARGLIIDEHGVVQMDSASLGNDDFLRYEHDYPIAEEFHDPFFLNALDQHLGSINDYFRSNTPVVIELPGKPYHYATIAPITATKWSVVTFYNSSSFFSVKRLLPLFLILLVMLICLIVFNSVLSYQMLFKPVELLIGSLARISGNQGARIYGIERDDEIGSLSKAIRDMLDKAHYDTLTGIYNRRYLDENLERMIASLSRSGGTLSVLMIDIDYFKQYNDTYGHGQGDECLKAIASALSESLKRSDDFVARYGGEEFVAVLSNADENGACLIASKMIETIQARNIPHETSNAACCVTVSIGGVTSAVTHTQCGADYIKRADEALYASKGTGRNRYTSLPLYR